MTTMNPEVKAQWVAELRSGKYVQGKGALQSNGSFCCLGVLCSISPANAVLRDGYMCYDNQVNYLPQSVIDWAGLDGRNPTVRVSDDDVFPLAYLNDTGRTFDQIADIIEENL